jgi:hypothetical protein
MHDSFPRRDICNEPLREQEIRRQSPRSGSNGRPAAYKAAALATELRGRTTHRKDVSSRVRRKRRPGSKDDPVHTAAAGVVSAAAISSGAGALTTFSTANAMTTTPTAMTIAAQAKPLV